MSCAPSWRKAQDIPYNIFLFSFGFFCPLTIITITSTIVIFSIKQDSKSIISENIKSSVLSRQYKAIKMVCSPQINGRFNTSSSYVSTTSCVCRCWCWLGCSCSAGAHTPCSPWRASWASPAQCPPPSLCCPS